ncbi:hypothetical protein LXL04_036071 [Taraxacum kok-saghyz]
MQGVGRTAAPAAVAISGKETTAGGGDLNAKDEMAWCLNRNETWNGIMDSMSISKSQTLRLHKSYIKNANQSILSPNIKSLQHRLHRKKKQPNPSSYEEVMAAQTLSKTAVMLSKTAIFLSLENAENSMMLWNEPVMATWNEPVMATRNEPVMAILNEPEMAIDARAMMSQGIGKREATIGKRALSIATFGAILDICTEDLTTPCGLWTCIIITTNNSTKFNEIRNKISFKHFIEHVVYDIANSLVTREREIKKEWVVVSMAERCNNGGDVDIATGVRVPSMRNDQTIEEGIVFLTIATPNEIELLKNGRKTNHSLENLFIAFATVFAVAALHGHTASCGVSLEVVGSSLGKNQSGEITEGGGKVRYSGPPELHLNINIIKIRLYFSVPNIRYDPQTSKNNILPNVTRYDPQTSKNNILLNVLGELKLKGRTMRLKGRNEIAMKERNHNIVICCELVIVIFRLDEFGSLGSSDPRSHAHDTYMSSMAMAPVVYGID